MNSSEFENELVDRAQKGDVGAAKELLVTLRDRLDRGSDPSRVSAYFANCLTQLLSGEISPTMALNLVDEENDQIKRRGGLKKTWDYRELASLHKWLIRFGEIGIEEANDWIEKHVGASRRTTQNACAYWRKSAESPDVEYLDTISERLLLEFTGSLRKNLARFQRIQR